MIRKLLLKCLLSFNFFLNFFASSLKRPDFYIPEHFATHLSHGRYSKHVKWTKWYGHYLTNLLAKYFLYILSLNLHDNPLK